LRFFGSIPKRLLLSGAYLRGIFSPGQRATPSAAQNTHPESNTDYGTTTVYAPLDHKALLPATEPETASTTAQSRYEESPTATLAGGSGII